VLSSTKMVSQLVIDRRLAKSSIVMATMCRPWNLCFSTLKTLRGL
jgi:hypothetical protein